LLSRAGEGRLCFLSREGGERSLIDLKLWQRESGELTDWGYAVGKAALNINSGAEREEMRVE